MTYQNIPNKSELPRFVIRYSPFDTRRWVKYVNAAVYERSASQYDYHIFTVDVVIHKRLYLCFQSVNCNNFIMLSKEKSNELRFLITNRKKIL